MHSPHNPGYVQEISSGKSRQSRSIRGNEMITDYFSWTVPTVKSMLGHYFKGRPHPLHTTAWQAEPGLCSIRAVYLLK